MTEDDIDDVITRFTRSSRLTPQPTLKVFSAFRRHMVNDFRLVLRRKC